jgi:threonyl-tRNA synthetase
MSALESHGLDYQLNEGDGAFYGPKIDMHMTDSLGRSWQLGTCQLDYNMPERFGLSYTGADNAEHRPVMIHRALMGSFERFIGMLIEHYAGEFPLWLAPVQAIVLPVADRHLEYAREVQRALGDCRRSGRDARGGVDHTHPRPGSSAFDALAPPLYSSPLIQQSHHTRAGTA